ncbi:MAG: type II toxin-antitoxin system RatA family toxin [Alphaproteobacteria bacterium]|nr:type II toxin-antitoxin system RatA family toxin [Alphaproteobacteria bacterium]
MPTHAEQRLLPYTPEQMYALVADIERYPEFLPWCVAARIKERRGDFIDADLVIGFKMFRERFTSHVKLDPPARIDVAYAEGPFRYLNNHWIFERLPAGCRIDFFVDFEFKSRLLQKVIEVLFGEAVRRMVAAFEARARQLYGNPAPGGASAPA